MRRTAGSKWRLLVHDAKGRALTKARHVSSYPMRNLRPDHADDITHLPDTEFDELVARYEVSEPIKGRVAARAAERAAIQAEQPLLNTHHNRSARAAS